jgi:hypothetical protein
VSLAANAFRSFVRRSDDARLERTIGSPRGLRFLFTRVARAYEPAQAPTDFTGELGFALHTADGTPRPWTIAIDAADGAHAHAGLATAPVATVRATVADLIRIAAGELDSGAALLDGRLDLEGDFAVASRLGAMFGRSGPY